MIDKTFTQEITTGIFQDSHITDENVTFNRYFYHDGIKKELGKPYTYSIKEMGWKNAKDLIKYRYGTKMI